MKHSPQIALIISLAAGLMLCRPALALPAYAITDLGASLGNASSNGIAINQSGTVLLGAQDAVSPSATDYYSCSAGALLPLGSLTLPGSDTGAAVAISDTGSIAGTSQAWDGAHAFLDIGNALTDLGNLGGGGGSSAASLNNSGHVVGWSDNGVNETAFFYANGQMSALAGLPGDLTGPSFAYGINGADQIVGEAEIIPASSGAASVSHAALWQNGSVRDLGSLAGPGGSSDAWAINDSGQIIGTSDTASGNRHAFFLDVNGAMRDMGTLGGSFSFAEALNSAAEVVGEAATSQNNIAGIPITHAFLWQHGSLVDLNSLLPAGSGWVLTGAFGINLSGQIVGTGLRTVNGVAENRAFLMSPIPDVWSAASLSVGADNGTRILWTRPDGAASLWTVGSGGGISYSATYGPFAGWSARKITTGSDSKTRILWVNTNGAVSYWTVDSSGKIAYSPTYGPFLGWTIQDIAVGPDGKTRLLWRGASGAMSFWTIDGAGRIAYSPTCGPYSDWSALSISVGGDNKPRILWSQPSGTMSFWTIDAQGRTVCGPIFGPFAGWTPASISTAADNSSRIMWQSSTGQLSFWTITAQGAVVYGPAYGPYSGWNANCLAVGLDGKTRILWNNPSGSASFWTAGAGNSIAYSPIYGPFGS